MGNVRSVNRMKTSVNAKARARLHMISKIEPAATISEKIALIDTMTQKHREALQLLNDLRITLIIEDAEAKHGERDDT